MESRLFAYGGTWAGKDVFDYVAMFLMVAHIAWRRWEKFWWCCNLLWELSGSMPQDWVQGSDWHFISTPLSTASEKTTERRTTCLLRSIIKFEHIYNRAIHPCVMNLAQNNTMLVANSTMFPMRLEIVSIKWVQDPGQLGTPANSHFYV